jgi:hypothetical protein
VLYGREHEERLRDVLRTQGEEAESPRAFAALHRLLLPVMRRWQPLLVSRSHRTRSVSEGAICTGAGPAALRTPAPSKPRSHIFAGLDVYFMRA